jgi:hypothetical protein
MGYFFDLLIPIQALVCSRRSRGIDELTTPEHAPAAHIILPAYQFILGTPPSTTRELFGTLPSVGFSTTTGVPIFTRL